MKTSLLNSLLCLLVFVGLLETGLFLIVEATGSSPPDNGYTLLQNASPPIKKGKPYQSRQEQTAKIQTPCNHPLYPTFLV